MITIRLKDGKEKEFESAVSLADAAKAISNSLGKNALVAKVNGELTDLRDPIVDGAEVEFFTKEDPEGLFTLRHTASHVMAQAIQHLFPGVKFAIGPAIDDGFYYDLDSDHVFSQEDFAAIEKEMSKIAKENIPLVKKVLPRDEALQYFKDKGQDYKVMLIEDLPEEETISLYEQGDFTDLCAGPHLKSTGKVKTFKLMTVAGAYWRGDSKNKMLQRIYATAFFSKEDLDHYLFVRAEAEKRDHRKLGKQLDLFSFHEEGPGFPFFHPKGMILRNKLMDYERELFKEFGYVEIMTPVILSKKLWLQSGHWDHYKENMYFTQIDDEDYAIKPMNCPGGILFFKTQQRSYRDLPMRVGEFGLVHRHELKGALHGLFRVRCFTQDDAHIFMTQEQMKDEVIKCMAMYQKMYGVFGLEYHVELSTRPENSMGSDELWEISTNALREAIETAGVPYQINEGDGAFYGPKLDFHVQDSLGRTWQCGTIQMDMQLPERFDVNYIGEDGEKHRAVMLHRAGYGSLERFIGILIEHYAGAFPTWIAPVQAKIIPVTDKNLEYAKSVAAAMSESDIRVEVEEANETLGYKIRKAQMEKVPYMIIVGDQEMKGHTISVRSRKNGDLGSQSLPMFVANLIREIKEREN
ncbi:MAG: threonine--tRNA ligase [Dialister sp.]|jgi:threonyl-tRNA synthetase|uniref:threonine--tRNA ligase n=1 Tax=Dialister sp. TaxID=1955814 RepID=UPI001ED138B4|nr:threonine--tRNA ligase [Dialister sp.]MBD9030620.1 threonine--tRNA ligase [Dialister sp.]MDD6958744.1 threonine--tRNA ligase [Dialister sp.]MDD7072939.1 threonine--tRNA ligase [Dialister sp.]MDD7666921.1 threonine--tRNA ligase [Dialister sp.]